MLLRESWELLPGVVTRVVNEVFAVLISTDHCDLGPLVRSVVHQNGGGTHQSLRAVCDRSVALQLESVVKLKVVALLHESFFSYREHKVSFHIGSDPVLKENLAEAQIRGRESVLISVCRLTKLEQLKVLLLGVMNIERANVELLAALLKIEDDVVQLKLLEKLRHDLVVEFFVELLELDLLARSQELQNY